MLDLGDGGNGGVEDHQNHTLKLKVLSLLLLSNLNFFLSNPLVFEVY